VELYFDLVFVFAVGQLTHLIISEPKWASIVAALGLFVPLWWTWIGFVVLYNRHGEDRPPQRLFLIAGTVPCAFAAVEIHGATAGHLGGFAFALAASRLLLAVAYPFSSGEGQAMGRRAGLGYALSTALFVVSAALPAPWQYVLWAVTLTQEAGFLLLAEQRGRPRRDRILIAPPADQALALNAGHLAERFNLFMIIMFGELVISLSSAAADVSTRDTGYWLGLTAGLVLAGALWWIYFDFAADVNRNLLQASGGNPAQAYAIYAGGYLPPAFALLLIAAGAGLALQQSPPAAAVWLVTIGLATYLAGIRGLDIRGTGRRHLLRLLVVAATVSIALLNLLLVGPVVVAVAAAWAVGVAATMSRRRPEVLERVMRAGAAATAGRS
jgi:low temperature requirement protein LtrA